jgi:hypothetical protein
LMLREVGSPEMRKMCLTQCRSADGQVTVTLRHRERDSGGLSVAGTESHVGGKGPVLAGYVPSPRPRPSAHKDGVGCDLKAPVIGRTAHHPVLDAKVARLSLSSPLLADALVRPPPSF